MSYPPRTRASHAIVFVPGFVLQSQRSSPGWEPLDEFLQAFQLDRELGTSRVAGSVLGYGFTHNAAQRTLDCDFFGASWDDRLDRLSARPPLERILRAFGLAWLSCGISIRQVLRWKFAFAVQTILGFVIILMFGFAAISALLAGIQGVQAIVHGVSFQNQWVSSIIAILVAFGLSTDELTDIVDTYRRYLREPHGSLRNRLVDRVAHVIDQICDTGYDCVTIVAHSFGALLAVDALSQRTSRPVNLITIGASFLYLRDIESVTMGRLLSACATNSYVDAWLDITASNDPVATGIDRVRSSFDEGQLPAKMEPISVKLRTNWWDTVTFAVHRGYFTDENVRKRLLPFAGPATTIEK